MKFKKYRFLEKLGSGTHGSVYLMINKKLKPKLLVCKSISVKYTKYADNEISIIRNLAYKRIIRFYDSLESGYCKCIIMEYANYGDLEKLNYFLRRRCLNIERGIAWSIFAQLIDALAYLHKKKIIHRDVKPGNVLLHRVKGKLQNFLQVKLCDFSLSKTLQDNEESNHDGMIVGTPYYMAPEIVLKKQYNYTVDTWSMGVVMYELIAKMRPFESDSKRELRRQITTLDIRIVPNCRDFFLKRMILDCLKKENRASAAELRSIERIKYHLVVAEHKYKIYRLERLEKKIQKLSKNNGLEQKIR